MPVHDNPLDPSEVARLLDTLCVDLGFCVPPVENERLLRDTPTDVESFTRAVFAAEGFDPELANKLLYRQVRAVVQAAFENGGGCHAEFTRPR